MLGDTFHPPMNTLFILLGPRNINLGQHPALNSSYANALPHLMVRGWNCLGSKRERVLKEEGKRMREKEEEEGRIKKRVCILLHSVSFSLVFIAAIISQ